MNETTRQPLYALDDFVAQVRGHLIVSCQALPDEPLYGAEIMARMAVAAHGGGARAIRANTPVDIAAIRAAVNLPIIGLYKEVCPGYPVYITPTLAHAKAVAQYLLQRKLMRVAGWRNLRKLAEDDAGCLLQLTGQPQLRQHAVDAVDALLDIFQEENGAACGGCEGRAGEMGQQRQVAAHKSPRGSARR